jgi:hypothetical protein
LRMEKHAPFRLKYAPKQGGTVNFHTGMLYFVRQIVLYYR